MTHQMAVIARSGATKQSRCEARWRESSVWFQPLALHAIAVLCGIKADFASRIVDVFDTDGHLLRRFASRGPLNSPWGMTRASFDFGRFSGLILVGNFGNGKINLFSSQGDFIDELDLATSKPLVIAGFWHLTPGCAAI